MHLPAKHLLGLYVFLEDKQLLIEKEIILQFHYSCPIADEIWYLSNEIIITYPPMTPQIQLLKKLSNKD